MNILELIDGMQAVKSDLAKNPAPTAREITLYTLITTTQEALRGEWSVSQHSSLAGQPEMWGLSAPGRATEFFPSRAAAIAAGKAAGYSTAD